MTNTILIDHRERNIEIIKELEKSQIPIKITNLNSADFAIKILNVLTDSKMGERLGLNARLLIETKYSWMAVAESFEENYCNYIKKHKKCSGF